VLLQFYKYQGTGNDFIMVDNRLKTINLDQNQIARLCHRRFGIGADGLMLMESAENYDFKMVYYNADGKESSMCGNGGRCIAAFAQRLGVLKQEGVFVAIDGAHPVEISDKKGKEVSVSLKMIDVAGIEDNKDHYILNTGSPHYIAFTENLDALDVLKEGRSIRYNDRFSKEGINVNFVQVEKDKIKVRTYERGVEDETYSCGTGVTAAALVAAYTGKVLDDEIPVEVPGGNLNIKFKNRGAGKFADIWLEGPATFVFKGEAEI
jgi:diaminopimelate epimerase